MFLNGLLHGDIKTGDAKYNAPAQLCVFLGKYASALVLGSVAEYQSYSSTRLFMSLEICGLLYACN